jgi:AraC-like DNA-binding protein
VVPDGCADVIVGLEGGAVAVGLADEVALHDLGAGSWCRGLRLRPEAVAAVLGVRADELRNRSVPLDDVVGARRARQLVDTVVDAAADARLTSPAPARVRAALGALTRTTVDGAAEEVGLSARQLRRLLLAEVGLGPKAFQRVARLQRFLGHDGGLARAAAEAGYADQAHLTREVVRLCGLPPAALRAERAS